MIIDNVKVLLGLTDNSKDELLEILLSQAEADAKIYTNSERLFGMDSVIERMVVFLYNRLGTEGLVKESYSGASYEYSADYPDYITSLLDKYREDIQGGTTVLKT